MSKIRFIIAVALLWMVAPALRAQTDAQFSQYYEVPTLYNPAAAGQTDYLRLRGAGRLQWVGIDNAPQTFLLTGDMPFKFIDRRFAAGLVMQQESAGLYKSLNLSAQLGFKFKKWGGEFTVALQPGMYDQHFKGSEVFLPDGDDYHQGSDEGIPTTDLHGTAFDLGAGVWYQRKNWHAGLSITHLTSPTIKMGGENGGSGSDELIYEFKAARTLYFMAGCNIPVKNTLFELVPSLMVKSDFTFTTAEITARARYNRFLSFGIGYRWNDAVVATIAAEIKNFYVGYSYDYATSAIHSASSGSHEIVVGYSLKLDLGDKNRNRHKSIRIM
ncbi:MAG: PorP/SprF family type IX secretion system membrane protein [Muribaculaceae bacterium]|nr:PorP/SprF family type IX secretion system membrane protein [Muribaculaceae bacterium]